MINCNAAKILSFSVEEWRDPSSALRTKLLFRVGWWKTAQAPFPNKKSLQSLKSVSMWSQSLGEMCSPDSEMRENDCIYGVFSFQFSVAAEIDCLVTDLLMTEYKPSRGVIRVVTWTDLQILVTQSCLLCWHNWEHWSEPPCNKEWHRTAIHSFISIHSKKRFC